MASPGYPQMGQQPMMQHHQPYPMGGPMGMQPQRPMRRGTSRAVPVVVSAGLAVGVFCGLLFGLGTGTTEAAPEPAKGNNVKSGGAAEAAPTPTTPTPSAGTTTPPPSTGPAIASTGPTTKNPAAIAAGTGSPTTTTAGAATGSAATPPAGTTIKLTVEITPDAAAQVAKIVIDGKEIEGKTIDLPIDKKSVKVSITAAGFHSIDKKIDLAGPGDTTIKQEMAKRGSGPASPGFGGASTGGNHVPTSAPKPPKKPPNSGIIDI